MKRKGGKVAAGELGWAKWQLVGGAVPHSHVDKPVGTTGEPYRSLNPGLQHGEIKPQNLWI